MALNNSAAVAAGGLSETEFSRLPWPEGTTLVPFEDLEGAIILRARLCGAPGRDTSGALILDTGAGFLGVDRRLGRWLGVSDDSQRDPREPIGVADRPLSRLELGAWQSDQVSPLLTVDGSVMSRVTGRPILGLLGQAVFGGRVLVLDYAAHVLSVLPSGLSPDRMATAVRGVLSPSAVPIRIRLAGDGKILLDGWIDLAGSPPRKVRLVLDTGATKTVLFRPSLDRLVPAWRRWPRLRGLGAPTLTGDAAAQMTRVPALRVGPSGAGLTLRGMDAAVLGGELAKVLAEDVGEPVDGLLGYSFLKHYRVAIDYPGGWLWLDPKRGDVPDRAFEYCHPGIQLETGPDGVVVYSVITSSPAQRAGLRKGDLLVAIDGVKVVPADLTEVIRRLEGPPGSTVRMTIRRAGRESVFSVVRERLL
jgi:hypothetical protein